VLASLTYPPIFLIFAATVQRQAAAVPEGFVRGQDVCAPTETVIILFHLLFNSYNGLIRYSMVGGNLDSVKSR
jgi:hypothetical protein